MGKIKNIANIKQIKRLYKICPFCKKEHELLQLVVKDCILVSGLEIHFLKNTYYCPKMKENFVDTELVKLNAKNIKKAKSFYLFKKSLYAALLITCMIIAIIYIISSFLNM